MKEKSYAIKDLENLTLHSFTTWNPPHIVVLWKGEEARRMVTVVVHLMSGVT